MHLLVVVIGYRWYTCTVCNKLTIHSLGVWFQLGIFMCGCSTVSLETYRSLALKPSQNTFEGEVSICCFVPVHLPSRVIPPPHTHTQIKDHTFWTEGYRLVSENSCAPHFLAHLATPILTCGKGLNLLKLCNPSVSLE